MDQSSDELFSGTALSSNEYSSPGWGDLLHHLTDFSPGRTRADDLRTRPLVANLPFQGQIFHEQRAMGEGFLDGAHDLFPTEWFDQIIKGSRFHSLDRRRDILMSRHHDHHDLSLVRLDVAQQFQAIHFRHSHIAEQEVQLLPLLKLRQRLLRRDSRKHDMPFTAKDRA